jgi:hypothetical protein
LWDLTCDAHPDFSVGLRMGLGGLSQGGIDAPELSLSLAALASKAIGFVNCPRFQGIPGPAMSFVKVDGE